jgi:hypothetical protein
MEVYDKQKEWKVAHKDEVREYQKKYREDHKGEQKDNQRRWQEKNSEKEKARKKIEYEHDKESGRAQAQRRAYYVKNKSKCNEQSHNWYEKNKTVALEQSRQRQKKNRARESERRKIRYHNDLQYRLRRLLRSRLGKCLKNKTKKGSAIGLLGCTIEQLIFYLESQFRDGMNWGNYGTMWSIDHIYPLSKADLEDTKQLELVCHYSNLQPLTIEENSAKRDLILKDIGDLPLPSHT